MLPGKFKAWLFQQGLLSRLMWLLAIYEERMAQESTKLRVSRAIDQCWLVTAMNVISGQRVQGCKVQGYDDV